MVESILRVARERLGRGWCQGHDALDVNGHPVAFWTDQACAWSLLGAIVASSRGVNQGARDTAPVSQIAAAVVAVADAVKTTSLNDWNDDPRRTQHQVLAALDAVMASLAAPAEASIGPAAERQRVHPVSRSSR